MSTVAVVGSANLDVVVHTADRPAPGETVLGTDYEESPGGKGLNQALAAAREAPTSFVGAVGADPAGDLLRAALAGRGVDVSHLAVAGPATGRAFITVTPDGENSIVVAPLANRLLRAQTVTAALDALRPAVVLAQREILPESVSAAATWARDNGAVFVLNPSPVAGTSAELVATSGVVVANVHEARALLGSPGAASDGDGRPGGAGGDEGTAHVATGARDETAPPDEGPALAAGLAALGPRAVVTAGGAGCWVAAPDETGAGDVTHVPALAGVVPVDTTGAGDAFAGTLAARLAQGATLVDAVRAATEVAGRLVGIPRADR